MARLLERGGNVGGGSLTLLATVLSDGSDEREPLSDAARSTLDGHIVLASELARRGHFPAIDILASASRTMPDVLDETRDARELGFLQPSPAVDRAVAARERIEAFLRQSEAAEPFSKTLETLHALAASVSPC